MYLKIIVNFGFSNTSVFENIYGNPPPNRYKNKLMNAKYPKSRQR